MDRLCIQTRLVLVTAACLALVSPTFADEGKPPAVGDTVEDFVLENLAGDEVRLSKLAADGPVVVVVLRGWPGYQCPICSRQVGELVGQAERLSELGATVVLVYPGPASQLAERAKEFLRGNELPKHFNFVTDPGYEMTVDYHLRWDAERETAYPSTFVVDPKLTVTFAKVSRSHGGRSKAAEVIAALEK